MKTLLIYLLVALCAAIVYWVLFIAYKVRVSKGLIESTIPYSMGGSDFSKTMLVLGDSTAYGVGAYTPKESVPGLMANFIGATYVENHAVSGALIEDVQSQIDIISRTNYDLILIQIGGNDIVRFHNTEKISSTLEAEISPLKKLSSNIVLISAGNVGKAPLIPPPFRPFYTKLNLKYHASFEKLANRIGILYINMYMDPSVDPFVLDPVTHFAKDSFHPSSIGYKVWFQTIKAKIDVNR